jgi:amino acid permease
MEEKKGEVIETYNPTGSDIESNDNTSNTAELNAGAGLKRQLKNRHVAMIRYVTAAPPTPLQANNS